MIIIFQNIDTSYLFSVNLKVKTMCNKTLLEIYKERKVLQSPAMNFVNELSAVTTRSVTTVQGWLTGKYRPDINTQRVLARHFKTEVSILFPPKEEES